MSKNRTDNPNIASGRIETLEKDEIFVFGSNSLLRIGCGIAGLKDEEIAPLFKKAATVCNIYLPKEFFNIIATPYLKHCSYYGKDVPEDCGAHVGHQYEGCWVNLHLQVSCSII